MIVNIKWTRREFHDKFTECAEGKFVNLYLEPEASRLQSERSTIELQAHSCNCDLVFYFSLIKIKLKIKNSE